MVVQEDVGTQGTAEGLSIALISVHGRIRGHDLELGVEPDTGGQTRYVVELARALARRPEVGLLELFTRRIVDPELGPDYARHVEPLAPGAQIVRLDAGPEGHLRKEELWDHLDAFADNLLAHILASDRAPDVVHAHYADAGYVGLRVARHVGCPLLFTGHSLGRIKRRRLLASGQTKEDIERRYHISRRIEAEEVTLEAAELVITSTAQELEEQYAHYDHYRPSAMRVIPPGIDLGRFCPEGPEDEARAIREELSRFLRDPDRPLVLAIARPDERKNLAALVQAFGEHPGLREVANLAILAGTREDLRDQEEASRQVILGLLTDVDRHDLYGQVALPKHHAPEDVPRYYRLAARTGGVFVNPALTEPFGLTLLEAAASGLPIVATEDGGPQEIIANCRNGELVDPLDAGAIAATIFRVLSDRDRWDTLRQNGIDGVRAHYSWAAHAERTLAEIRALPDAVVPRAKLPLPRRGLADRRAVFTDIDQNLLGGPDSIGRLAAVLKEHRSAIAFGIATGRSLRRAQAFLREFRLPQPDVLITNLGTRIHYAPGLVDDTAWREHVDHLWNHRAIRRLLDPLPGLTPQDPEDQDVFKVSYHLDSATAPALEEIVRRIRSAELSANVFQSFGHFLDVVPVRASKGAAIRYVAQQWGIPFERILAAGGSGADEDMIRGNVLGVVVANRHREELSQLVDLDRVYFARRPHADGILEAFEHYGFFGASEAAAS